MSENAKLTLAVEKLVASFETSFGLSHEEALRTTRLVIQNIHTPTFSSTAYKMQINPEALMARMVELVALYGEYFPDSKLTLNDTPVLFNVTW